METETAPQQEPQQQERQTTPISQEMLDKASKTLATMLDYLGLEASVKVEGRNTKINLLVSSDDAGRIIGRKGQSLESLQLLVNRMAQKADPDFPKVYIDIDGYSSKRGDDRGSRRRGPRRDGERGDDRGERSERGERGERGGRGERRHHRDRDDDRHRERRHHSDEDSSYRADDAGGSDEEKDEVLRQQALDTAKEVKRWGEPVTLPPMNSHDRRLIHVTLQEDSDLQTESLGDGNLKSVIISLKKKD